MERWHVPVLVHSTEQHTLDDWIIWADLDADTEPFSKLGLRVFTSTFAANSTVPQVCTGIHGERITQCQPEGPCSRIFVAEAWTLKLDLPGIGIVEVPRDAQVVAKSDPVSGMTDKNQMEVNACLDRGLRVYFWEFTYAELWLISRLHPSETIIGGKLVDSYSTRLYIIISKCLGTSESS